MIQANQATATRPQQADEVERHRRRLSEIYQPQTSREEMIIAELAVVYQEKEAFERDHKLWMHHEAAQARHAFKRQEADDFLKLQRQWPKAPAAIAPVIGQSLNGVTWMLEIWQIIVARLAPTAIGPVPGIDQACQALLAMGFSDKIQNVSEAGWWWATRFLAIQTDQDAAIKAWLRKSGTCDKATELQQARHKLYDAPDPTTARQELYDKAVRQVSYWSIRLKQLQNAEPARQEAQQAQARCMGLKIPGLATCLNNAIKLQNAIQKSIKFMEDRLEKAQIADATNERSRKRASILDKLLASNLPPAAANLPPVPSRVTGFELKPIATDQGQALEAAIRKELLPQMAAVAEKKPEPAKTYFAHTPQPERRPMSNRKKRLAKMAAKEERARLDGALRHSALIS
jgi:hypothetical protein